MFATSNRTVNEQNRIFRMDDFIHKFSPSIWLDNPTDFSLMKYHGTRLSVCHIRGIKKDYENIDSIVYSVRDEAHKNNSFISKKYKYFISE